MNKLTLVPLLGALLLIGSTGPSCGGTQALQQQVDQLTTKDQDQTRMIQALESQVKLLQTELGTLKALTTQIGNTVLAQKQAMDSLRTSRAAPARSAAKAATSSAKKKPARHARKH